MQVFRERRTVTFTQPVYEEQPVTPPATGTWSRIVGEETCEADIEIEIDVDSIAREMGRRAAQSKGRKATDGRVIVRAKGAIRIVNRVTT